MKFKNFLIIFCATIFSYQVLGEDEDSGDTAISPSSSNRPPSSIPVIAPAPPPEVPEGVVKFPGEFKPIHEAVMEGDLQKVQELLKSGSDPNSALFPAIYTGHLEIVRHLLKSGADPNFDYGPNSPPNYDSPLIFATILNNFSNNSENSKEIIKLLVEHGANLNKKNLRTGKTAADIAWYEDVKELLAPRLDSKADQKIQYSDCRYATPPIGINIREKEQICVATISCYSIKINDDTVINSGQLKVACQARKNGKCPSPTECATDKTISARDLTGEEYQSDQGRGYPGYPFPGGVYGYPNNLGKGIGVKSPRKKSSKGVR